MSNETLRLPRTQRLLREVHRAYPAVRIQHRNAKSLPLLSQKELVGNPHRHRRSWHDHRIPYHQTKTRPYVVKGGSS